MLLFFLNAIFNCFFFFVDQIKFWDYFVNLFEFEFKFDLIEHLNIDLLSVNSIYVIYILD